MPATNPVDTSMMDYVDLVELARTVYHALAIEYPAWAGPPEDDAGRAGRAHLTSLLAVAVARLSDEHLGDLCWCNPGFASASWGDMPEPLRAEISRRGLSEKIEGAWHISSAAYQLMCADLFIESDDDADATRAALRLALEDAVRKASTSAIVYYLGGGESSIPGGRPRCPMDARPLVIAATHARRRPNP
jgi:hypothetical protein